MNVALMQAVNGENRVLFQIRQYTFLVKSYRPHVHWYMRRRRNHSLKIRHPDQTRKDLSWNFCARRRHEGGEAFASPIWTDTNYSVEV